MKLGKSKLALAKVINENGGWVDDSANWAVQPKREEGDIWFSNSDNKPYRNEGMDGFTFDGSWLWLDDIIKHDKLHKNWHQCVLSREEYYQAYPEVTEQDAICLDEAINLIGGGNQKADADGWVEWGGGECPVERGTLVDVKYSGGEENFGVSALTEGWQDDHVQGSNGKRTAVNWVDNLPVSGIVSYRLHKPEVKPEFCESVMRSIPEPKPFKCAYDPSLISLANVRIVDESIGDLCAKVTEENKHNHIDTKPTIEQLAQDYRNAKGHAERLQKEAGEAAVKAESFAVEIRKKILELQELIG